MKEESGVERPKSALKKPLGRGLGAILTDAPEKFSALGSPYIPATPQTSIDELSLDVIEYNPYQPRQHFDEGALQDLADSIRVQGIIQPITVRRLSEEVYQLIAGERRLQASRLAGLTTIPAYIRVANDEQMLEMALIENIQREELNPVEIAMAYRRLMDECSLTIEAVAEKVGKKRPTINNYLRLLKLPPEIQAGLRDAKISMGHARALISVDNPVLQLDIYKDIISKELSVRQVEELVRMIGAPREAQANTPQKARTAFDIQLQDVQRNLAAKFNTKIHISAAEDGKGEIRFRYYSKEDLDRLLELLQ